VKITKDTLKQIIKEEIEAVTEEMPPAPKWLSKQQWLQALFQGANELQHAIKSYRMPGQSQWTIDDILDEADFIGKSATGLRKRIRDLEEK